MVVLKVPLALASLARRGFVMQDGTAAGRATTREPCMDRHFSRDPLISSNASAVPMVQVMSFPGSEADTELPGAKDQDGKDGKEIAPGGSVFAVLQAYATHVFAPTVRAYAAARGGDDKASVLTRVSPFQC